MVRRRYASKTLRFSVIKFWIMSLIMNQKKSLHKMIERALLERQSCRHFFAHQSKWNERVRSKSLSVTFLSFANLQLKNIEMDPTVYFLFKDELEEASLRRNGNLYFIHWYLFCRMQGGWIHWDHFRYQNPISWNLRRKLGWLCQRPQLPTTQPRLRNCAMMGVWFSKLSAHLSRQPMTWFSLEKSQESFRHISKRVSHNVLPFIRS